MGEHENLKQVFRDLRFGMFIHFNMASYENVQWVEGYSDPSRFDPGGLIDTDAWADAAVEAGMQYGVLTTKHVGGFCLWHSRLTDYGVAHSDCPYPCDLVEQFVRSFTSRGLKAGLYYCWRNPGFDARFKVLPPNCDPDTHSLDEQNQFQLAQINELIERFPGVFYIWNDALDDQVMAAEEFRQGVRSAERDVLHSGNWWDWGRKGEPYLDIAVTEKRHFPPENTQPGETCWCLEDSWFYNGPSEPKSGTEIVEHLHTANSREANLLLNLGPDRTGKLQDSSRRVLAEVGRLLRR